MKLNVNQMLLFFLFTSDFAGRDLLEDVTNHARCVAHICARLAKLMSLPEREFLDSISYALLRDNGITRSLLDRNPVDMAGLEKNIRHYEVGEENVSYFPFNRPIPGVILYHRECQDGSGFLGKRGREISFFSRLIALSNRVAVEYAQGNTPRDILGMLKKDARLFDPELLRLLLHISQYGEFWLNMQSMSTESEPECLLLQEIRGFGYQNIRRISRLYSNITDVRSPFIRGYSRGISRKVDILCRYYGRGEEECWKMRIAADSHDPGKIMVPNEILDKPGSLTREEIDAIQSYIHYTHKALEMVQGFEDITEWAANHHEKLDGKGYPYGLTANQLDFSSRMLAYVGIYQALAEDRPYRMALPHEESVGIPDIMAKQNLIDGSIVKDIDVILGTVFYEEDLRVRKSRWSIFSPLRDLQKRSSE